MTVDDRGLAAVSELRDRAATEVDIDAALVSTTARRSRGKRLTAPTVAAAAVVLIMIFVWAQDHSTVENAPPADSTPTTPSPRSHEPVTADAFIVNASTGSRTQLPRHIAEIPLAHNFVASPDGTQIAFSDFSHLYTTTLQPGVVRTVGRADQYTVPDWSPAGDQLVYTLGGRCVVLDLETGRRHAITRGSRPVLAPNFNQDGSVILYTRRAGQAFGLWETDLASGREAPLTPRAAWGFYSPDGTTIAFRSTSADDPVDLEFTAAALSMMTASGQDIHELADGSGLHGSQVDALAFWPTWSPDGTHIANQGWHARDLHILDAASGAVVSSISTETLDNDVRSSWIDDERLIVEGLVSCTTTVEC